MSPRRSRAVAGFNGLSAAHEIAQRLFYLRALPGVFLVGDGAGLMAKLEAKEFFFQFVETPSYFSRDRRYRGIRSRGCRRRFRDQCWRCLDERACAIAGDGHLRAPPKINNSQREERGEPCYENPLQAI